MGNLFRLKKMNIFFVILFFLYPLICNGWVPQKINKYGLITNGFGIVGKDDLAYDIKHRIIDPYNPNKSTFGIYWQCVPTSEVSAMYRTWRGDDPMGPSNVIVTMCELEIRLKNKGELHIYGDRRGHLLSSCREFIKNWLDLTAKEKIVCINGELPSYERDDEGRQYIGWTWNKFKTKKGCYAYFGGDCDVAGAAKQSKQKFD